MLIETSSNLVREHYPCILASGVEAEVAELINDRVLTISSDSLALFRSRMDVSDPLGNGLLHVVGIPAGFHFTSPAPYIVEHCAGYVGLTDGKVLLVGLNDARLFANKRDALSNRSEIVRIPLA